MRKREALAKAYAKRHAAKRHAAKRHAKRRTPSTTPMCPYIVARFNRMLECMRLGIPYDYGIVPPGRIRLWSSSELLPFTVFSQDYTLKQWINIIAARKTSIFVSEREIAVRLESSFFTSQKYRWYARQWISRVRRKIMDKRIVGEEDFVTLQPIPCASRVTVYDLKCLRRYDFHTTTIYRTLLRSLLSNSYGIPNPHAPKNPFTNVPWSYGQMLTIVSQILQNLGRCHRFPHKLLRAYRNSEYDIKIFLKIAGLDLKISAAREFFGATEDPVTREIYEEVIDDLYGEEDYPASWRIIARLVKKRMLSLELMREWDNLVIAFWLYSNYKIFIAPYWSYEDIDNQYRILNSRSHAWWRTQPRRILPRGVTATTATTAIAATTATATTATTATVIAHV